ncbi:HNH endonuclease [Mycoplasmopsis agassizii]|uniref:HNH endonuclease n=1 Tax=Mycoplasmopsis agassizii TaxID=33922 RepID=UPI0035270A87
MHSIICYNNFNVQKKGDLPDLATIDWGKLYEKYKDNKYDPDYIAKRLKELYVDDFVTSKKGAFEFLLTHEKEHKLLQIRFFTDDIQNKKYKEQTDSAHELGRSNCKMCWDIDKINTIYKLDDMEADHIKPWSEGGDSTIENCEMLCKKHNRAKSNY